MYVLLGTDEGTVDFEVLLSTVTVGKEADLAERTVLLYSRQLFLIIIIYTIAVPGTVE